jgi:hypothetical protein
MSQEKYIGMDVHQATISVAIMDGRGKLIMECILETKAGTILEFIQGLRGSLWVSFEEGTSAAWLHDLLVNIFAVPRNRSFLLTYPRLSFTSSSPSHLHYQGYFTHRSKE